LKTAANNAWVNVTRGKTQPRRYVAYYRVSTKQQGRSGLGLEAQRASVQAFLRSVSGELFAEFTEVESGTRAERPQFHEALRTRRIYSAALVIARLDRLVRNVALISMLMESDIEFIAADFPHANRLTIHILAAIAEYEAASIGEGTGTRRRGIWKQLEFGQRRAKAARYCPRGGPRTAAYGTARQRKFASRDCCGA
jgi:DNA invertase Pin-like site-specific DNA recombinase